MGTSAQTLWLTDYDLYLFGEGTHLRAYEKLGAHPREVNGRSGVHFAVWAPNAERVSVVGEHNGWDPRSDPMQPPGHSGNVGRHSFRISEPARCISTTSIRGRTIIR